MSRALRHHDTTMRHPKSLIAGAFAVGLMTATAVPAAEDAWCVTRERIPDYSVGPTTRVVRADGPITPTRIKRELCAGGDVMHCVIITHVDRIPGQPLAAGLTDRQCGQTPKGRACVSHIAIVRAGSTIGGRTLTDRCERDTLRHEMAHALTGWRH